MKVIKQIILPLITMVIFSGCFSIKDYMTTVPDNKIKIIKDEKATIVFMRSSFVGSAITATLFEVNDGNLTFIGFLPNATKIAHRTKPGKKVYMAYGYAADFMIANVEAGKTYYSIVRPNWGTGGFAPTPVRRDGTTDYNTSIPEFQDWLYDTKLLEAKSNINTWMAENGQRYHEIYVDYWNRFEKKTPDQKAQRTLTPEDGI